MIADPVIRVTDAAWGEIVLTQEYQNVDRPVSTCELFTLAPSLICEGLLNCSMEEFRRTFKDRKIKQEKFVDFKFYYHVPTQKVFNHDSFASIRFKCCLLTIFTPIFSIMRTIYFFVLSFFRLFATVYPFLDGENEYADLLHSAAEAFCDSFRAIIYGGAMTAMAIFGLALPLEGRLYYGLLEKKFNRQPAKCTKEKTYLAYCFQSTYILNSGDSNDRANLKAKLLKYV